jgi:uncharacterized membrane protein
MSTIIQVAGMAAVTAGVAMLSITAGLIVGGCFLIATGIAMGRN